MKIISIIMLLACVMWQCSVAQEESESRSVPARGLLKRNPLSRTTTTTTTTTPSPLQELESEYEDSDALYSDQEIPISPETPTSTEGKKNLVGSGVRPFRSNVDLLEALKKKRVQAAQAKQDGYMNDKSNSNSAQENVSEVKTNYSSKKRTSTKEPASHNEDLSPQTPKPAAGYRGRFTRPPQFRKAVDVEQQEQDKENNPSSNVRSGRTFRRGGN